MEIQGEVKMTISKFGSALAFCLAMSAGQAQAEPVSVTVENRLDSDLQWIEFLPQNSKPIYFRGPKQNAGIISKGKSGIVTFDKPSGVCEFIMLGVPTTGPNAMVLGFDVCKLNRVSVSKINQSSNQMHPEPPPPPPEPPRP
jgi:hypothetical protein